MQSLQAAHEHTHICKHPFLMWLVAFGPSPFTFLPPLSFSGDATIYTLVIAVCVYFFFNCFDLCFLGKCNDML